MMMEGQASEVRGEVEYGGRGGLGASPTDGETVVVGSPVIKNNNQMRWGVTTLHATVTNDDNVARYNKSGCVGLRPSRKIKANSSSYCRGETREDDGTKRREKMERGMTALNTSGTMMTNHTTTGLSDDDA